MSVVGIDCPRANISISTNGACYQVLGTCARIIDQTKKIKVRLCRSRLWFWLPYYVFPIYQSDIGNDAFTHIKYRGVSCGDRRPGSGWGSAAHFRTSCHIHVLTHWAGVPVTNGLLLSQARVTTRARHCQVVFPANQKLSQWAVVRRIRNTRVDSWDRHDIVWHFISFQQFLSHF